MRIRHQGLGALHVGHAWARRPAGLVAPRLRRILFPLHDATHPAAAAPGFRLHAMRGTVGANGASASAENWRAVFRFEGDDVVDAGLLGLSLIGTEH